MESIDILFLTLAGCLVLVTIFLTMTLIYLMFILRDVVKVTDQAKEIVDKVNTYVTKPLLLTKSIIEFVGPFVRGAEEKLNNRRRKD